MFTVMHLWGQSTSSSSDETSKQIYFDDHRSPALAKISRDNEEEPLFVEDLWPRTLDVPYLAPCVLWPDLSYLFGSGKM